MRQSLALLIATTFTLSNFWQSLGWRTQTLFLQRQMTAFDPHVMSLYALLWGIVFTVVGVLVWRRTVRGVLPVVVVLYALYHIALPTSTFPTLYWHVLALAIALWTAVERKDGQITKTHTPS